jgi:hypothetical protein
MQAGWDAMTVEALKDRVRAICKNYSSRELRARRLYIEERAASLNSDREREFSIRKDVAACFRIPHSTVSFCGSAQLGFSVHQNKLFEPAISDLDVACIDLNLYQKAWVDVATATRGFSDLAAFGSRSKGDIDIFQQQILRRAMIRIDGMPVTQLSQSWSAFLNKLSVKHASMFSRISVAIYMNEYAFCWKQDSAIITLLG